MATTIFKTDSGSRTGEDICLNSEERRGTGLGMSMVYGILKSAGGYIYVNSDEGVGTTISIYLPLLEGADVARAVQTTTPTVHRNGSGQTILVVEDETSVRRLTQRVLLGAGFQVVSASTGAEAVALVVEDGLFPDLVLTDVVMPGISGKETAERIRQSLPSLPVLYMSGYSDDIISPETFGPDESILHKPFRSEQLLDQAWALLENRAKKVEEPARSA